MEFQDISKSTCSKLDDCASHSALTPGHFWSIHTLHNVYLWACWVSPNAWYQPIKSEATN